MKRLLTILAMSLTLAIFSYNASSAATFEIEKEFLYDKYTLEDSYPYQDTVRRFQWDKIEQELIYLDSIQRFNSNWAILKNKRNVNGIAPPIEVKRTDEYKSLVDAYGVPRNQSIPIYRLDDTSTPERYGRDGSLVKVVADSAGFVKIVSTAFEGVWLVPDNFVAKIETERFTKVIVVDRTNQNITSLERSDYKWLVRSMNKATTGRRRPPYQWDTPLGIFVVQEKRFKMVYNVDGTNDPGGYAPYASRFSNGGYIHGIPVNIPNTEMIETSTTLGTTPRSHMCVRNATSHAKFLYDWAPVEQALVVVIE